MSELVIDQQGRIEIPLHLRVLWGLTPGRRLLLEADETVAALQLRPLPETGSNDSEPRLLEENGFLVIEGGADLDLLALIEQDRTERLATLMEGATL